MVNRRVLFTILFWRNWSRLLSIVAGPYSLQFCISLNGVSANVNYIYFKPGKRMAEASLFPSFHRDVVVGGPMIDVLRQTLAIAAHIGAAEMQYSHTKTLDASNLPLDIGHR